MMRFGAILGVFLVISAVAAGFVVAESNYDPDKPCSQQASYEKLVCGATPSSTRGYGAVDICSECYPCGVEDGVCPEDFYSGSQRASCRNCPDPDCSGNVTVTVRTENSGEVAADVYVIYPDKEKMIGNVGSNDILNASVRSGLLEFRAEYSDFDSEITEVYVPRGGHNKTTITLAKGSCNSDCTSSFTGRCKPECDGVNNCSYTTNDDYSYTAEDIKDACNGRYPNDRVKMGSNETHSFYALCCTGSDVVVEEKNKLDISANFDVDNDDAIKHLAHHVIPVETSKGEIVELVVTSFEK